MRNRILLIIRIIMGSIFILYAYVKFTGMQLGKFELNKNIRDVDSVTLLWYFFGYSRMYVFFLAFGELIAGILIIWTKTFRIGALMYFGIATNIAIMDWSYHIAIPASILATILALLSLGIVINERKSYKMLLQ